MKGVNLENSQMAGVNLRVATLKNANLKNSNLRGAILAGTDLEVCLLIYVMSCPTHVMCPNLSFSAGKETHKV